MLYSDNEITCGLDGHWYVGAWIMEMGTDLSDIDDEEIYNYYDKRIHERSHSTVCQVIPPKEWITRAVGNNIDLSYNDYCRHFDMPTEQPQFVMSENEFIRCKEECTIGLAKEVLL